MDEGTIPNLATFRKPTVVVVLLDLRLMFDLSFDALAPVRIPNPGLFVLSAVSWVESAWFDQSLLDILASEFPFILGLALWVRVAHFSGHLGLQSFKLLSCSTYMSSEIVH